MHRYMRIKGGGIKKFDSKIEGRVVVYLVLRLREGWFRLESRMKDKTSNVS